ncbi:705_t:CDS:1, partial [Funneliformis geosporum]
TIKVMMCKLQNGNTIINRDGWLSTRPEGSNEVINSWIDYS